METREYVEDIDSAITALTQEIDSEEFRDCLLRKLEEKASVSYTLKFSRGRGSSPKLSAKLMVERDPQTLLSYVRLEGRGGDYGNAEHTQFDD